MKRRLAFSLAAVATICTVGSGVYLYRLEVGGSVAVKKMIIAR